MKKFIDESQLTDKEIFNNKHYFSANGIMMYAFLIIFIVMIFKDISLFHSAPEKPFFGIVTALVLFGIFSYTMNYFVVSSKYLVVKNSIWLLQQHVYDFEDIKEVVIDMPSRSSIRLRIITTDSNKVYQASSLTQNTWKELIKYFEKRNITVHKINFD
ncbi:hypothetical protein [Flavobacterium sp.]|jgi:hypothetical protein|uniref:hypothetical protein n=1 Tax=Flavobacterium sp. TaxID=239 RepID=UPI0037BE2779